MMPFVEGLLNERNILQVGGLFLLKLYGEYDILYGIV